MTSRTMTSFWDKKYDPDQKNLTNTNLPHGICTLFPSCPRRRVSRGRDVTCNVPIWAPSSLRWSDKLLL